MSRTVWSGGRKFSKFVKTSSSSIERPRRPPCAAPSRDTKDQVFCESWLAFWESMGRSTARGAVAAAAVATPRWPRSLLLRYVAAVGVMAVPARGKPPPLPSWMQEMLDARPKTRASVHRSAFPEDPVMRSAGASLARGPSSRPVIVGMTTTPTRVAYIEPALRSLLNQTQPCAVVVNIPRVPAAPGAPPCVLPRPDTPAPGRSTTRGGATGTGNGFERPTGSRRWTRRRARARRRGGTSATGTCDGRRRDARAVRAVRALVLAAASPGSSGGPGFRRTRGGAGTRPSRTLGRRRSSWAR